MTFHLIVVSGPTLEHCLFPWYLGRIDGRVLYILAYLPERGCSLSKRLRKPTEHPRDQLKKYAITPITLSQPPIATKRCPGRPAMRLALATTPKNEPVASSSRDPNGPCSAVEQVTKNETQVDLTAEIPEAPADRPAQQLASNRSATLQHQTLTE